MCLILHICFSTSSSFLLWPLVSGCVDDSFIFFEMYEPVSGFFDESTLKPKFSILFVRIDVEFFGFIYSVIDSRFLYINFFCAMFERIIADRCMCIDIVALRFV
eukprot:437040_1